ncbi:o-succinylbenzoate synthase, partial [Staphylococcus saprophyticus]
LKWSTSLIKDLETIRLLNLECDIAIDANESLTKPAFLQLANEKTSDIVYIEEPFKILEDLNDIDMSIFPRIAIDEKALSIEKIKSIIQQYPI